MTLTAYPIPVFGGLNLVDDPEEVGANQAIDLLNVDLDKQGQGRIRSRDGYNNFTTSASADRLDAISPFYKTDGTKQLLTASYSGILYRGYSSTGVMVAEVALGGLGLTMIEADFTRFGGPGAEVSYASSRGSGGLASNPVYKWDGSTWATAVGVALSGVPPLMLEVTASDNRLVGVFPAAQASRIGFSDAGTPETFTAANYVDLTPGDGERVTALVSWRELVFAFKESKFFVFTGNSAGPGGLPLFNYRAVSSGLGTIGRQCAVASPAGVYFLSRRGIYLTTGGDPILISRAIDPIFQGGLVGVFATNRLNFAAIDKCALHWHAERLYFSYPSGTSTVNNRILVFDPKNNYWTLWNIPAGKMCTFRPSDGEELMFSYASGANHIGRHSSTYSDDDGTAIASHYQSGFYAINPSMKTTTRWTELWGSGTLTFDMLTDHSSSDPLSRGGVITLGTAPQVTRVYHNKSYMGQLFSHRFESDGDTWSLNRIEHQAQFGSQPQ